MCGRCWRPSCCLIGTSVANSTAAETRREQRRTALAQAWLKLQTRMNEWTDGQKNGRRTDGRTDRWMDERQMDERRLEKQTTDGHRQSNWSHSAVTPCIEYAFVLACCFIFAFDHLIAVWKDLDVRTRATEGLPFGQSRWIWKPTLQTSKKKLTT